MKNYTLHYHCLLGASAKDVCAFHTDTNNLPMITPPSTRVRIVSIDVPLVEKSRIVLDIRRFGITTRWDMEIEKLNCPHVIVDNMLKGPFSAFRHERHFIALEESVTMMEETITFALPIPWFEDVIFWFLKKDMDAMFAYRHSKTQEYFNKKSLT